MSLPCSLTSKFAAAAVASSIRQQPLTNAVLIFFWFVWGGGEGQNCTFAHATLECSGHPLIGIQVHHQLRRCHTQLPRCHLWNFTLCLTVLRRLPHMVPCYVAICLSREDERNDERKKVFGGSLDRKAGDVNVASNHRSHRSVAVAAVTTAAVPLQRQIKHLCSQNLRSCKNGCWHQNRLIRRNFRAGQYNVVGMDVFASSASRSLTPTFAHPRCQVCA